MDKMADKRVITVEHHCLELRHAHLRVPNASTLTKLILSIEAHGQLSPVVIVPEATDSWVLIDGYHRVKALKRLGKDLIEAEVWDCPISDALIMMLRNNLTRPRGIVEEALVLHELYTHHDLSQETLAKRMGRGQSWVSGRLSLVEHLSESLFDALTKGSLSLWVCGRILTPIARAIPEHAQCMLSYLLNHPHSTREMQVFYDHYQSSNAITRARMVGDPALFFKAHACLEMGGEARALRKGVEGEWSSHCQTLTLHLSALNELAHSIFFKQTEEGCRQPLKDFSQPTRKFEDLSQKIRTLTDSESDKC